ncbi:hypothetical protein ABD87_14910 [Lysinibacillus sphaericus]|uniref:hypothetical protein n=1 Tax=Lysinibacillus sphaericus TaxID=1421 RepID=UPI0018CCF28E|nr:hypothetical protein [Lysinibacillus sphaericus]MBG9730784.1 hypothetical protein [Lysinibacillus sphaericus]
MSGELKVIRDVARNFLNNATVIQYFLQHCDKNNVAILKDCKARIGVMQVDNKILKSASTSPDERVQSMIPFFTATNELMSILNRKGKVKEYAHQCKMVQQNLNLIFPTSEKEELQKQRDFLDHWISRQKMSRSDNK